MTSLPCLDILLCGHCCVGLEVFPLPMMIMSFRSRVRSLIHFLSKCDLPLGDIHDDPPAAVQLTLIAV